MYKEAIDATTGRFLTPKVSKTMKFLAHDNTTTKDFVRNRATMQSQVGANNTNHQCYTNTATDLCILQSYIDVPTLLLKMYF